METGTASCFAPLAADRLRRLPFARPTSSRKTRVRDFCAGQSGRFSSRRRRSGAIATGCRACGYKTASGRSKWPNRDPLGDMGTIKILYAIVPLHNVHFESTMSLIEQLHGPDLYCFVKNNPISDRDSLGLESWDQCMDRCHQHEISQIAVCTALTAAAAAACFWFPPTCPEGIALTEACWTAIGIDLARCTAACGLKCLSGG